MTTSSHRRLEVAAGARESVARALPNPREIPFLTPEQALSDFKLPIGRSAFYVAIKSGTIPGVRRVGKKWLLSTAALYEWAGLEPE